MATDGDGTVEEIGERLYWGEDWGAPVCEGAVQSNTPPWGELCGYCREVIVEGESGTYTTMLWAQGPMLEPVHKECSLRMVLGGIGHHLNHTRWCVEQRDPDGGMTFRESALLVWQLYRAKGMEDAD